MLQAILSFVLIANILACPLRCATCAASAPVDEQCESTTGCPCCSHADDQSPASEVPVDSPSNDCSCPNCICQGATLEVGREIALPELPFEVFEYCSVTVRCDAVNSLMRRCAFEDSRCTARNYGRNALIAHQIWLI
jgi:hypothetical protein